MDNLTVEQLAFAVATLKTWSMQGGLRRRSLSTSRALNSRKFQRS